MLRIVVSGLSLTKMNILLAGVTDAPLMASIEERIAHAMKTTGSPVTLTTFTMFISLLVCGILADLLVVKNFCWFTGK